MTIFFRKAFYPVLAFLFILYAFLLFKNLGHYPFWDDEANTAIFSRNLLQTGELTAFDGRNLAAYSGGIELNSHLKNIVIPPFQYYATAGAFKLMGESNFSARFPFAVMGLLCFVFFLLINQELSQKRGLIVLNMFIFTTNIAFILFMRQCRYYAPMAFFFLLSLYLLIKYYKKGSLLFLIGYTVSSILLFLSQYNVALGIMAALLISFVYGKKWDLRNAQVKKLIIAYAVIGIFIIVYFLLHNPFNAIVKYPGEALNIGYKFFVFYRTLTSFDAQTFLSLLLVFAFLTVHWGLKRKIPGELGKLFYFFILCLATYAIFAVNFAIRYSVYLVPIAIAIEGNIVYQMWHWPLKYAKVLATSTLLLLIFTSILFVSSGKEARIEGPHIPINFHLIDYLGEITSENPSTYSTLIDYFESKEDSNHTILIYPRFMTFPLMYYLGDQYLFPDICEEDKIDCNLPPYIYKNNVAPDFIVFCDPDISNKEDTLKKYLLSYVLDSNINFYYKDMTRPEYNWRNFDVVTDFDEETESIFIYRLCKPAS